MPIAGYIRDASGNPVPVYRSQELEDHPVIAKLAKHPGFVQLAKQQYPQAPMNEALANTFHWVWRHHRNSGTMPLLNSLDDYVTATLTVAGILP